MTRYSLLDIKEFPAEIASFLGPVYRLVFPPQGDTSIVAVAEAHNGKYVVKRAKGEQFAHWLQQEYKVLCALTRAPLPTPHPHAFVQRETIEGPESWLVMDYLPGKPFIVSIEKESDQEVRQDMLRAFGSILATIHHLPAPSELRSNDQLWLDQMLEHARYNFLHYKTDGNAQLLEELERHRPRPVPSTLIHGDFTVDNVLFSGRAVTGVIDWVGGGEGDPRYDLALAIRPQETGLFQGPQDRQAFFEGYGEFGLSEAEYHYFVNLYEFF